jgi:hypothetical protein
VTLPPRKPEGSWINRIVGKIRYGIPIIRELVSADIVHWYFCAALPYGLDVRLAWLLRKKMVVEFWGSDVRDPLIECQLNPWFQRVWSDPDYEYSAIESAEQSARIQQFFGSHGAIALLPAPSIQNYILKGVFRRTEPTAQRLAVTQSRYKFVDPNRLRPVVAHSPTAPIAKGTKYIDLAVEALKKEGVSLDYDCITGATHQEACERRLNCDIFIDQLIYGDYGLSAVEAMAAGKPVVCFLRQDVRVRLPSDCPVVQADPNTITDVLRDLLSDGQRRFALGESGRRYVEKYHSVEKCSLRLLEIYRSL